MTRTQAEALLKGQSPEFRKNMHRALKMHPWLNTPEEWDRLEAGYTLANTPHAKRIKRNGYTLKKD